MPKKVPTGLDEFYIQEELKPLYININNFPKVVHINIYGVDNEWVFNKVGSESRKELNGLSSFPNERVNVM